MTEPTNPNPNDRRLHLTVVADMVYVRGDNVICVDLPEELNEIEGRIGYWFFGSNAEKDLAALMHRLNADHGEHATFELSRTRRRAAETTEPSSGT